MRSGTWPMWCAGVVLAGGAMLAVIDGRRSARAEPPPEAEVERAFRSAAPALFESWLADRPDRLKKIGAGRVTMVKCRFAMVISSEQYIQFLECADAARPESYRIDVEKSDSFHSPFVGHLLVPISMNCTLQGAVVKGSEEKRAALTSSCVGGSYRRCLGAGAKPLGEVMKDMCSLVDVGVPFVYTGEERVTYGFSEGEWAFHEQYEDPPLRPADGEPGRPSP